MKFLNFGHPLVVLVGILALLLTAPLSSSAEEEASTLSGRVVDMAGHPVSDLTLGIQPIDMIEGEMWQMPTPTNGHAYKKIRCKTWEDASALAIAEGAHLVSINNEAEQEWLVEIFGQDPFLIGLTRLKNRTEWQWTSGEPVTYTNWALRGLTTVQEAFVFVSMIDGKWRIGTPESLQRVGIALLEKEVDRLDKSLENK